MNMNHNKDNDLVEGIYYYVKIRDDYYSSIKVEGKYNFTGKLIVHVGNQLVFNLKDGKGSVVLPFNFIEWMIPSCYQDEEYDKKWVR